MEAVPQAPRHQLSVPVVLGLLLVVAFSLRFTEVTQPLVDIFSWRESSTAMMAKNFLRGQWNILYPEVDWTGPGPNYQGREFPIYSYAVAQLWRVFGESATVGRVVSVLAGTWAVFAMFQLVRRVWDDESALWAAGVLAVLPGAVFIDRSFLPDPLMLSLLLTGCWWILAGLGSGAIVRWKLGLGLAVFALSLLAKLPAAIALPAIVYAIVGTLRRRGKTDAVRVRRWLLLGVVCLLPVLAYYTWALHLGTTYPPFHIAGTGNWVWSDGLLAWLAKGYYLPMAADHAVYWLWTWPVLALAFVGLLFPPPLAGGDSDVPTEWRPRWFFHFWLAGGAVLCVIGLKELVYNVWNLHAFNAAAAAFAGLGLARVVGIGRSAASGWASDHSGFLRAAFVLLCIAWIGRQATAQFYHAGSREGRELGLALGRLAAPDDLVVTIANDVGDPVAIYYSGRRGWVFPPKGRAGHRHWNLMPQDPATSIRFFESLRREGADWFGIVADPKDDTPGREEFWQHHREFVEYLQRRCEMVEKTGNYVIYRIPKG